MKNQLTIRGIDEELAGSVRRLAARERVSLNQAAIKLLRQGAGLSGPFDPPLASRRPIEDLFGAWTPEYAAVVERSLAGFSVIASGLARDWARRPQLSSSDR